MAREPSEQQADVFISADLIAAYRGADYRFSISGAEVVLKIDQRVEVPQVFHRHGRIAVVTARSPAATSAAIRATMSGSMASFNFMLGTDRQSRPAARDHGWARPE